MAETSPDNYWSPENTERYNVPDFTRMMQESIEPSIPTLTGLGGMGRTGIFGPSAKGVITTSASAPVTLTYPTGLFQSGVHVSLILTPISPSENVIARAHATSHVSAQVSAYAVNTRRAVSVYWFAYQEPQTAPSPEPLPTLYSPSSLEDFDWVTETAKMQTDNQNKVSGIRSDWQAFPRIRAGYWDIPAAGYTNTTLTASMSPPGREDIPTVLLTIDTPTETTDRYIQVQGHYRPGYPTTIRVVNSAGTAQASRVSWFAFNDLRT